jgi:hypothetical protein
MSVGIGALGALFVLSDQMTVGALVAFNIVICTVIWRSASGTTAESFPVSKASFRRALAFSTEVCFNRDNLADNGGPFFVPPTFTIVTSIITLMVSDFGSRTYSYQSPCRCHWLSFSPRVIASSECPFQRSVIASARSLRARRHPAR